MGRSPSLRFLGTILVLLGAALVAAEASNEFDIGWAAVRSGGCQGSMAECGMEFEMESESSRRILATTQYISYGALQSNTVPCNRKGASYYNCKAGAQANPYSRSCSQIARFRTS